MAKAPKESDQANSKPSQPAPKGYDELIVRWTRILGISTIALCVATGVSAYFLYETDQTIKKQVEAAGIQLRAYINISTFTYYPHFQAEPNRADPGANVGVVWKNFGTTPAREMQYWISVKWYGQNVEPDFTKPEARLAEAPSEITMAPGSDVPSAAVFVPLADIQKLDAKNGRVFFWGHASYKDYIPGSPIRNFRFCFYTDNLPAAPGVLAFNVYKAECNYAD